MTLRASASRLPIATILSDRAALAQERELASQFTVWTPAEIEMRRQRIEEWALQRWAVTALSQSLTSEADDDAVLDEELASHQDESP